MNLAASTKALVDDSGSIVQSLDSTDILFSTKSQIKGDQVGSDEMKIAIAANSNLVLLSTVTRIALDQSNAMLSVIKKLEQTKVAARVNRLLRRGSSVHEMLNAARTDANAASRLIARAESNPEMIVPQLLSMTSLHRLARRDVLDEDMSVLFAALAASGTNDAHSRLVDLSAAREYFSDDAKTALLYSRKSSMETFNKAASKLPTEENMFLLASLLEHQSEEFARSYLTPYLQRLDTLNPATTEEMLAEIITKLDALSNLGTKITVAIDSVLPYTFHRAEPVRKSAFKALLNTESKKKLVSKYLQSKRLLKRNDMEDFLNVCFVLI